MPTPKLPDEHYQAVVDAYQQALDDGYKVGHMPSAHQMAAKSLKSSVYPEGMDDDKFRRSLSRAKSRGFKPGVSHNKDGDGPVFPTFSDDDIPTEEIIDHLEKRVKKKIARDKEERWYSIKLPNNKPWGGLIFGDPHMGTHCNWPLLREHVDIAASTDGLYGISVGDLTDSWPINGRLARLWAENDMSTSTEWKLTEWFTQSAGITWLAYILGNHDGFGGPNAIRLFQKICKNLVPVTDGEAKFIVKTPNGAAFPFWVRHDFKGHSQFNANHGLMRALREEADVERGLHVFGIQGHKHHWAIAEEEVPERGYFFSAIRARGYKVSDGYAKALGFSEQEYGASILITCNPQAKNLAQQSQVWKDVGEGAEYLTWLRGRYK
jgi:hypothetical protein